MELVYEQRQRRKGHGDICLCLAPQPTRRIQRKKKKAVLASVQAHPRSSKERKKETVGLWLSPEP